MKFKYTYIFFLLLALVSCKNQREQQELDTEKDLKKKEIIFENIKKGWVFNARPMNTTAEKNTLTWNEWRLFLTELAQKPNKSIRDFQKKATELSKKVMTLNDNIPSDFDKPQIKARIATLITKVRLLDLFIHLNEIPDQKIILLVGEINAELASLQNQMDKLVQKSQIPLEEGESELLKMLDTTRAIPNVLPDPNLPRVE